MKAHMEMEDISTGLTGQFKQVVKPNLSDDEIDTLMDCGLEPVERLMELFVLCTDDLKTALEDAESHMEVLCQNRRDFRQVFNIAGRVLGFEVDTFDEMTSSLARMINDQTATET